MAGLIQFICPKCGKELVWALETAKVQCNGCFTWVQAKDIKDKNKCKLSDDTSDQLTMF